jgi:signal transduction histidine kinase
MIIENNQNEITRSIEEEINEIENYIEQALYYARSEIANKDYYIKKCNLKDIVNEAIKKNKKTLINKKIKIETINIEKIIYTDSKWTQFILNQIILNSIKYKKELNPEIICEAEEKKEKVILKIKDNGIGIKETEISRVFDKGFTGTNGRIEKKSTGIGLYLCKKLCNNLGMGIEINSKENEWTELKLIFPKNSFTQDIVEFKK